MPPRTPPTYAGPRPEPARDGYTSHTASIDIAVPVDEFRAWINGDDVELSDLLQGSSNAPAVVGTQTLRGSFDVDRDRVGARRRVHLDNGHFVAEEVLVDTPEEFRYIIWGFTSYHRMFVHHAVARFRFEDAGRQTHLVWTYAFQPTSWLARPLVSRFVSNIWVDLMSRVLETMRTGAERHATTRHDQGA